MPHGQAYTAVSILKKLQEKSIDPKQLTAHQRKLCIRYFMDDQPEVTIAQMAKYLGINHSTISRIKNQIIRQDGWIVDKIDQRLWMTKIIRTGETVMTKLWQQVEKADNSKAKVSSLMGVHKVLMDITDKLMDMGYLERKPIEIEGRLTLLDIIKIANEKNPRSFIQRQIENLQQPASSGSASNGSSNGSHAGNGNGVAEVH